MNSFYDIVTYFKEILDIPNYYIFSSDYKSSDFFDLYGHIGDIDIYIYNVEFPHNFNCTINSRLLLTDNITSYELLLPIDDYTLLVINDIIKYFKGVIL